MDKELYKKELLDQNNTYEKISQYLMPYFPKSLYKYGSLSSKYWEDFIFKGKVYLSKTSDFNDPFDCLAYIDFERLLSTSKIRQMIIENYPYLIDEDLNSIKQNDTKQRIIYGFQEDIRAACFSEEWNSILMWSHYSDSHKGFCIEYDAENMSTFKKYMFFPMLYQEYQIDITDDLINLHPNAGLISMVGKAQEWNYEKEWRMISLEKNVQPYMYLKKDMRSITLGLKCENEYSNKICDWASKNFKKVYQIKISPGKYEMERKRII